MSVVRGVIDELKISRLGKTAVKSLTYTSQLKEMPAPFTPKAKCRVAVCVAIAAG